MASEDALLTSFLLGNELRDNVPLKHFTSLFQPAFRNSPQVKDLYREFQAYRAAVRDAVRKNIAIELGVSASSAPSAVKPRDDSVDAIIDDVEGDRQLTLQQSINILEEAESHLALQIASMEREIQEEYLPAFHKLDKDLSSLRLNPPSGADGTSAIPDGLNTVVIAQLKDLADFCNSIEQGSAS